jgi:hypothetical protein
MSAWGYKPFENDDSLDWLYGVMKPIKKVLKQKPDKADNIKEYGPQRMAIELIIILKSECRYDEDILKYALIWLDFMATDKEFLECWGDKKGILLDIKRQKNVIKEMAKELAKLKNK